MTTPFSAQVAQYAKFLRLDKGIPGELGFGAGAFMLMARDSRFFMSPHLWAPPPRNGCPAVRVYFDAWSQNKMPAVGLDGKFYFDAETRAVVFVSEFGQRLDLFNVSPSRLRFSGAKTREVFYDARERMQWLSAQLAAMS